MKKLFAILLIAFFAVGFSSCAEESFDTEPVIPEVNLDAMKELQQQESKVGDRKKRKVTKVSVRG